ncbi:hypothetical protein [Blattabacterium cuenoti]|uniref:hypothetical protein n=1 Tax=Blattabacterium cuenoti TaxID=1653831 RepID=UPI00163C2492|nr:hypothetical protein [Blattabacterium cuenoti]
MVYKKILIIFITGFTVFYYNHVYSSKGKGEKTIELGNFSEEMNIPGISISFEMKKKLEDYILLHNPSSLVLKNGDLLLEGKFTDYRIYSIKNYPLKIIEIKAKIFYKDNSNPEKNWTQNLEILEKFPHEEVLILDNSYIIDRIAKNFVVRLYNRIFNNW